MIRAALSVLVLLAPACVAASPAPPVPLLPVPSPSQLRWHALETYAFVHFNMNTFTGQEWGEGTEDPDLFQPSELDCAQWARVCKQAGLKGIILTAKHHDGFCLWPSDVTTHDVASSTWRAGRGDVLAELSAACRAEGLLFGVYLSPWDRNAPAYGDSPRYNDHYVAQLEEVLTRYGEVFEVWWDGACGEGPNGKRQVYDWERFRATVCSVCFEGHRQKPSWCLAVRMMPRMPASFATRAHWRQSSSLGANSAGDSLPSPHSRPVNVFMLKCTNA